MTQFLDALAVLRAEARAGAVARANDQRHFHLPTPSYSATLGNWLAR